MTISSCVIGQGRKLIAILLKKRIRCYTSSNYLPTRHLLFYLFYKSPKPDVHAADFKAHLPEFLGHILKLFENAFQLINHHLHVAADAFSRAGGLRGVPGRSSAEGHPLQGDVGPVANRLMAWGSQVGVHVFGYKEPQCY